MVEVALEACSWAIDQMDNVKRLLVSSSSNVRRLVQQLPLSLPAHTVRSIKGSEHDENGRVGHDRATVPEG